MKSTIFTNIDSEKLSSVYASVEESSEYYLNMSQQLVQQYTGEFDTLMQDLKRDIIDNDATDFLLEKYLLELNNMIYFLSSKLEIVGIKDDLSKIAMKEIYNNAYLSHREKDSDRKNKLSVAELSAIATNESRYEEVLNSLYSRVYKQIKAKVDAGYDTVGSLRKIITRRMQETSLGMYGTSRVNISTSTE